MMIMIQYEFSNAPRVDADIPLITFRSELSAWPLISSLPSAWLRRQCVLYAVCAPEQNSQQWCEL